MSALFPNSALVIVYGLVLLVGLALIAVAVLSLLRSFTPGSQSETGQAANRRLNRAATYALGLGTAVIGAVGLLALLVFRAEPTRSVIWSLGFGLVAGFAAELVLVYLSGRGQGEETALAVDADGRVARVVIPIPANGVGEVAYRDGEEMVHLGARSVEGRAIPQGAAVYIERVTNRIAVVRRQSSSPRREDATKENE